MTAPTLWLEITIAGALYLAASVFLVLSILGGKDLGFVEQAPNVLPYAAVCAVALSYLAGILAHRLTQIVGAVVAKRAQRLFPALSTRRGQRATRLTARIVLWQLGSERLQREIDFQYGLVAVLRSLVVSVPFLGASVTIWLATSGRYPVWLPLAGVAVMWPLCITAYWRLESNFVETEAAAFREVRRLYQRESSLARNSSMIEHQQGSDKTAVPAASLGTSTSSEDVETPTR